MRYLVALAVLAWAASTNVHAASQCGTPVDSGGSPCVEFLGSDRKAVGSSVFHNARFQNNCDGQVTVFASDLFNKRFYAVPSGNRTGTVSCMDTPASSCGGFVSWGVNDVCTRSRN